MKVIGIETSCDETAVAVVEFDKGRISVLSNVVSSQVKLHAKYGGVVPHLASREHAKNIGHVFDRALAEAGISPKTCNLELGTYNFPIDVIAVTRGPGLGPSLIIGIAFAKTLAYKYDKPLIGVNHLDGHIHSNWLPSVDRVSSSPPTLKLWWAGKFQVFPALCVVVSGGHTELVLMRDHRKYKLIGETLDDAIGEAFDKVARLLGLGYPGGPAISKLAERGDTARYPLPSPMISAKNYNFSYSGLKTAVLYLIRDLGGQLDDKQKADIAASFQKAAIDVVVAKVERAAKEFKANSLMLSGGVAANIMLRERLRATAEELAIPYFCPPLEYTTDNAAMIALAGIFAYEKSRIKRFLYKRVQMDSNLSL